MRERRKEIADGAEKKLKNANLEKKVVSGIQNISGFQQGQFTHNYRKEGESVQRVSLWRGRGENTGWISSL